MYALFAVNPALSQLQYATHDSSGSSLPPVLVVAALVLAGFFLLSAMVQPRPTVIVTQTPVAPLFALVLTVVSVIVLLRLMS